jgi:hypothetical protein
LNVSTKEDFDDERDAEEGKDAPVHAGWLANLDEDIDPRIFQVLLCYVAEETNVPNNTHKRFL